MDQVGFEPTHPEIVGLKSTALDHSAIDPSNKQKLLDFEYIKPTEGSC